MEQQLQLQLQQQQQQQQQLLQQQPQQFQAAQEQTLDIMLNHGFFNHEAAASILSLQDPNFVTVNSTLVNNSHQSGLQARYNVLLGIVEELKKDIKPTYAGNKICAERLKRNINLLRIELRNCMQELERCE